MIDFKKYKDNIAIIENGLEITYEQLSEEISKLSEKIDSINGFNVALWLNNSIEYIVGYFANIECQNTIIPIYSESTNNEVYIEVNEFDVALLITSRDKWKLLESKKIECNVFLIDEGVFVKKNYNEGKRSSIKDVYLLLNTSGTTGKSKKVMHSQESIRSNARFNINNLSIMENDVCLICLPLNFGYANTSQLISHLLVGGTLVLMRGKFSPKKFIDIVIEYNVSITTLVPDQLFILSNLKNIYDLIPLKTICFGAGYINSVVMRKIQEKFPNINLVYTYGFTEAGPRISSYFITKEDAKKEYLPVGKPISNDIKIKIDTVNNSEVLVKTPTLMLGYYPFKEESSEWFRSGDVGFFDSDGNLVIKGRIKNILKVKGYTIHPEEIEKILLSMRGVDVCRVFEERENFGNSIIKVEYVGAADSVYLKKECQKYLSDYKIPAIFIKKQVIEKTYNGKVKRM